MNKRKVFETYDWPSNWAPTHMTRHDRAPYVRSSHHRSSHYLTSVSKLNVTDQKGAKFTRGLQGLKTLKLTISEMLRLARFEMTIKMNKNLTGLLPIKHGKLMNLSTNVGFSVSSRFVPNLSGAKSKCVCE